MSERLMLKGALEEKKQAKLKLATRSAGIIRALKQIIQPAVITPLKELRTDEAKELIEELHELRTQYLQVSGEMEEIEKELG